MSRWRLALYILIAILVLVAFFYDSTWFSRPPRLRPEDVTAVNLEVFDRHSSESLTRTTTDAALITELTSKIAGGTPTPSHLCSNKGRLTFTLRTGNPTKVDILPGHEQQFYEFKAGGSMFRVNREDFLNTLTRFGVARARFLPNDTDLKRRIIDLRHLAPT